MAHDAFWWEQMSKHALVIEACTLLLERDNAFLAGLLVELRRRRVRKSQQRRKPPASSGNPRPGA